MCMCIMCVMCISIMCYVYFVYVYAYMYAYVYVYVYVYVGSVWWLDIVGCGCRLGWWWGQCVRVGVWCG